MLEFDYARLTYARLHMSQMVTDFSYKVAILRGHKATRETSKIARGNFFREGHPTSCLNFLVCASAVSDCQRPEPCRRMTVPAKEPDGSKRV